MTTDSSENVAAAAGGGRDRRRLFLAGIVLLGGIAGAAMVVSAAENVRIENVSVSPETAITGEPVTVETTIANLPSSNGSVTLTDLYVRTAGSVDEHARIEDVGSIDPAGSVSVPVSVTFDSPGEKRLTVLAVTEDESGDHDRYEYPLYVDVEEPSVRVDLSTSTPDNSTDRTAVEVTNYGNTDLADIEVTASVDGTVVDRAFTFDVEPESSESVTFHTGNVSSDEVTFAAHYDAAGERHTSEQVTTIEDDASGVPAEIRLTRIGASSGADGTTIQGEAVNVGSTDAGSVMLRVLDPEGSNTSGTGGEYFVGPVEGSEFATFELTADVSGDRTVVPVEIGYNVDGERRTQVQRIDLDAAQAGGPPAGAGQGDGSGSGPGAGGPGGVEGGPGGPGGPASGGSLPLVPIGVVVVLLVGGFLTYRWRHQ